MKVLIDGTDYTEFVDGIDELEIEYELDSSNNTVVFATSNTLTFVQDAFTYLEGIFFAERSQDATADVILIPDCCDKQYLFEVNAKTISKYCPSGCEIQTSLVRKTTETRAHDYLSNTIFWKNGFIESYVHPKVQYCDGFTFLNFILLAVYFVFLPIILVFEAIAAIPVIGSLPGISQIGAAVDKLRDAISGCQGKFHPSPLIRNIFEFNCSKAGVGFQSSIISGDYNSTVLLQAQYKGGCENCNWIEKNAANLTTIQLAELLKEVFNADYRIQNGMFIFEREDYFAQDNEFLTDVEAEYEKNNAEDPPCYKYANGDAFAYGRFEYSNDPIDTEGNLVANLYNDIIEWNDGLGEFQKGEFTNTTEFSPAHFVNDEEQARQIITNWRTDHVLLLQGGISANFKLLYLEQGFNANNAFVIRRQTSDPKVYEYNYPLWFQESEPEGLYQRYHFLRNPNQNNREIYEMDDFEYVPDDFCEALDLIDANAVDLDITTPLGLAKAKSILIKFASKSVTLKDVTIR